MEPRRVDVLIVGAGIAGLLVARELRERGLSVALAHDPARPGASEAAVGLLNPVRGQRCTLAWRVDETFAAAREVYASIAHDLGQPVLRPVAIVRAFASAQERRFLERRCAQIEAAGFAVRVLTAVPAGFREAGHGAVAIDGGGALDARALTARLRVDLRAAGMLIDHPCAPGALIAGPSTWTWAPVGLEANRVVLAGGAAHISDAPGGALPLRPVRGESLLVRIPALVPSLAFVSGHHLAPVGGDLWSCGGTTVPGETDARTTPEGRAELEQFLRDRLTVPWETVEHLGGVRAGTLDTRPFVGRLPGHERLFAFNGFGSQGYSLAPWLARVLAGHLIAGNALPAEVDPARFGAQSGVSHDKIPRTDEASPAGTS